MLDQGFIKKHFVGRDGFQWWIGQVAPEIVWKENISGTPQGTNDDSEGFGERYRVRIMGYHTANSEDITDDELPWAYVMYPVTAGGGGRGSSQSANITQGTFVFGWFLDGEDAQIPIIMGCLGYNDYNAVMKNITPTRFIPFDGYSMNDDSMGQKRASYSIRAEKGGEVLEQENSTGATTNDQYTSSVQQSTSLKSAADKESDKDGQVRAPLAKTSECEKAPMSEIQRTLMNLMNEVQNIQSMIQDPLTNLQDDIADLQEQISFQTNMAIKKVAGYLKWVFTEVEKYILKKINEAVKNTFSIVPPDLKETLRLAVSKSNDIIVCLIRQLIAALPDLLGGFFGSLLSGASNKAVNIPRCFAVDFLATIFGNLVNTISNAINNALGAVSGIVGSISGLIGDVFGFITDIFSFLTCEGMNDIRCADIDEWSIFSGAGSSSGGVVDYKDLIGGFNSVKSSIDNVAGSVEGAIDAVDAILNIDFGGIFRNSNCFLGPRACGSPRAEFMGPGLGAALNFIVSGEGGEIVAADILNAGIGYIAGRSRLKAYDDCGRGRGAVVRPVIGPVIEGPDNTYIPWNPGDSDPVGDGIIDVIIDYPGYGYLPGPDGSLGGDGDTWAGNDDTIITGESDGSTDYYPPLHPGNNGVVPPGGTVTTPPNSSPTEIVDENGNAEEVLPGVPTFSENGGTITAPPVLFPRRSGVTQYPSMGGSDSYPVILYLCEIIVNDQGIDYKPTDKVVIEPNYGATATPKFDKFGRLLSVKVTAGGEGFQEVPKVYIETETGFGAEIIPKFCIDRLGSDDLEREPDLQDRIITVIDCVGKVNG